MNLTAIRRHVRAVDDFLRPSRAEDRSIPVLDGGLSPNDALDGFASLWKEPGSEPDDVIAVGSWVLVSVGAQIHVVDPNNGNVSGTHTFDAAVGAMAVDGTTVYVCQVGGPVQRLGVRTDGTLSAGEFIGGALSCPTDAVLVDGRLFVSEGSLVHGPDEWRRDLMTKGRSGRVVEVSLADSSGAPRVVFDGLAWAGGVEADPTDPTSLLVTETWRHRVVRGPIDGGPAVQVGSLLPGYPARMAADSGTNVLVSFLSLRTHLVEFVLREDEYRAEMVNTIDPEYWVSPTLRLDGERWEPLQIGSMKHLNVTKPWAPPRAYGLVARMGSDGTFLSSWHARVGSPRSGVTGMTFCGDKLVVACRGGRVVLTSDGETSA